MPRPLKYPAKLSKGDIIGIVAPSSDASFRYPHRLKRGISFLREIGFEVKLYPSVFKSFKGSAGLPEDRAMDLHDAFQDPSVKAIISTIGGYSLNEVLDYLDFDLLYKHAKVFCGYSDCSLLHSALLTKGPISSFYGPNLLPELAEFPKPSSYTTANFIQALSGKISNIKPSEAWSDEFLDWGIKADLTRGRIYLPNEVKFHAVRSGEALGSSLIFCLSSLVSLIGTEYLPPLENTILFIETPPGEVFGKGMSLDNINSALATLRIARVFKKISGLVVGRPYGHPLLKHKEFFEMVDYQTRGYNLPIIVNVDFGHTDPMLTLPCGVKWSP